MINILFVFPGHFSKGGTEAVMLNIFNNIDRQRFHIDFLLLDDAEDHNQEREFLLENGANIYYVRRRRYGFKEHIRQLQCFFREHKYHIVHTHMDASAASVLRIAKKSGTKVCIAHSHNTRHQLFDRRYYKKLMHFSLAELERMQTRRSANYYVACSQLAGKWLFGRKRCSGERFFVFNNAIDVQKYVFSKKTRDTVREELRIGHSPVIGHVGRFSEQKNHSFLIDVFEEIHKERPDVRMMLVGAGEDFERMQDKVWSRGLQEFVLFLGERDDVHRLMQVFDLFLFPSNFEGLGIVLIEAQTAGVPCLASSTIPEEANVTGTVTYMSLSQSPKEWAQNALNMLETKKERVSPLDLIREKGFDMKTNIQKLENFYLLALEREQVF